MKIFSSFLILAFYLSAAPVALAYDECWDASYAVGLYSYNSNMYDVYNACPPVQQPVCCDSCYNSATLYNEPMIQELTQMVNTNQQLINQLYGYPPSMQNPGINSPPFGNPYPNPYSDPTLGNVPPLLNYPPGNPYMPPGNPNPYYPPVAYNPPGAPYYPSNPYYPTSPVYPTSPPVVNPTTPTTPYIPPPPTVPLPYTTGTGCNNITVMCPVGSNPGGAPSGTTPVSLPYNPNLTPSYQTTTNQKGQPPVVFRVPRGMRNLSH